MAINNGLILQYNCNIYIQNNWVFPIAFSNLNYVTVATPITNTTAWPIVWAPKADKFITHIHCDGTGNYTTDDRTIYYNAIAIGY